jgi:hypothetical protein
MCQTCTRVYEEPGFIQIRNSYHHCSQTRERRNDLSDDRFDDHQDAIRARAGKNLKTTFISRY